jgi:hypothetical protein
MLQNNEKGGDGWRMDVFFPLLLTVTGMIGFGFYANRHPLISVWRRVVGLILALLFASLCAVILSKWTLPLHQRMSNGNPGLLLWVPAGIALAFLLVRSRQLVAWLCRNASAAAKKLVILTGVTIGGFGGAVQVYQPYKTLRGLVRQLEKVSIRTESGNKPGWKEWRIPHSFCYDGEKTEERGNAT